MNVKSAEFSELLKRYKKITVIGISPDPSKPSQSVPLYMKAQGYEVVGVNPGQTEIAGIKIYSSLAEVPAEFRKFVNVFRRPDHIPAVVDDVLAVGGVELLWLQLGITNPESERRAEEAGLKVVSNRCLLVEHRNLF